MGKVTPSPGLMVSMSTPISLVVRVFRVRSNGAWMSDEKYLLRHVRSLSLDESSCIQANSLPKTVFQSSNLTAQLKGQGWSGELTNKFPSQSQGRPNFRRRGSFIHRHIGARSRVRRERREAHRHAAGPRRGHTSSIARGIDASHRPSPHVRTGTRATQRRLFRKNSGC